MKSFNWKKSFGRLIMSLGVFGVALTGILTPNTDAKVVLFDKEGKYFEVGGRIQAQYHMEDPKDGDSTDEVFFRRLRPYIAGSLYEDWYGKFQIDFGKSEVAVKDAYFQYSGWKNIKLAIGNHNFPFSRELLTSSKKQQLVERTFVGDHNYGIPDRNLGIHLTGSFSDEKFTYGASIASACIDPGTSKLDFDTPANNDSSDWNEGAMFGGRIDWHPLGYLKMEQGDFKRKTLATIGAAAYSWSNDGDFDTGANDVDSVTGYEISGAFRGFGFSVDAEYNLFDAKAVDSTLTSGIYQNGATDLANYAVEGGYMILPSKLEVVAGYQVQDADGYAKKWTRTSLGLNYFIKKHDIKLQGTYRMGENVDGVDGDDLDEVFIQAQYVF